MFLNTDNIRDVNYIDLCIPVSCFEGTLKFFFPFDVPNTSLPCQKLKFGFKSKDLFICLFVYLFYPVLGRIKSFLMKQ